MNPSTPISSPLPWYTTAFDQSYLALYAHRNQQDARRALEFLVTENIVRKGELGLDLCCGAGRHLQELSGAGMSVVGIDLSSALLGVAAGNGSLKSRLVRGSMEHLPFKTHFHWIVNLFTSFGYFELDTDNERVLHSVSETLITGGRFLIDFLNAPFVRATLKPKSIETTPTGVRVNVTRSIVGHPPRVEKRMTFESQEIVESVRLFSTEELTSMLQRAGLTVTRSWGDFGDRRLGEMAPRCILLAEKI